MNNIFRGQNQTVVGMTRHGKSDFVVTMLKQINAPTLFINPQAKLNAGFKQADARNTMTQIIKGLKLGHKIEYKVNSSGKARGEELAYIIQRLLDAGFKEGDINLVIDEIHIYSKEKTGRNALMELASRGISLGMNSIFVSTRIAEMPYSIVTQSEKIYFFFLNQLEENYITGKGFNYDEIMGRIKEKGRYSHCEFTGEEGLTGAFKHR